MSVHAPTSNTAATLTVTPNAGDKIYIPQILWSYSGTPTGGNLLITHGGVTKLSLDISSGGPGFILLDRLMADDLTAGVALIVTLAAGGSGVSGKLNIPASVNVGHA